MIKYNIPSLPLQYDVETLIAKLCDKSCFFDIKQIVCIIEYDVYCTSIDALHECTNV